MLRKCYLIVNLYYVHRIIEPVANDPDLAEDFLKKHSVVFVKEDDEFLIEYPNNCKNPNDFVELKKMMIPWENLLCVELEKNMGPWENLMCIYFEEGNIVDFYNALERTDFCNMSMMETFKKLGTVNGTEVFLFKY